MTALKKTVMILYSGQSDVYSHQVRIALAEKGVSVDVVMVDPKDPPQDLIDLNPYTSVPTLVDRELVLYYSQVILEYLDERFPHPPLLPVYPVARAKSRLMIRRIENDWYTLMNIILHSKKEKEVDAARKQLKESLIGLSDVFSEMPYFLSEEFSLVDCYIAPLLWRLPVLGIELPSSAKAVEHYAERVFMRDSFEDSLTEVEKEMREVEHVS